MADDGTDDILRSIKDAQRNALMERAWKVGHEEMRRAGLSDTTIAFGSPHGRHNAVAKRIA
jgi:hypothetical protein